MRASAKAWISAQSAARWWGEGGPDVAGGGGAGEVRPYVRPGVQRVGRPVPPGQVLGLPRFRTEKVAFTFAGNALGGADAGIGEGVDIRPVGRAVVAVGAGRRGARQPRVRDILDAQ